MSALLRGTSEYLIYRFYRAINSIFYICLVCTTYVCLLSRCNQLFLLRYIFGEGIILIKCTITSLLRQIFKLLFVHLNILLNWRELCNCNREFLPLPEVPTDRHLSTSTISLSSSDSHSLLLFIFSISERQGERGVVYVNDEICSNRENVKISLTS